MKSEEIKSAEEIAKSKYPKKHHYGHLLHNGLQQEKQDAFIAGSEYSNQFKSEWVSVEDDKPEMGQDVICTDNHTCYSIGWYSDPEGFFTDKEMNVTHYMIFPTTPKVKQ